MVKVVLLTNLMPPYRVPVFDFMQQSLKNFEVWVDSKSEHNRHWETQSWPGYVRWVRALTIQHTVRRPGGSEKHSTYIPIATLFRLGSARPDVVIANELGARSVFAALYCAIFRKRLILWLALTQHTEANYGWTRSAMRKMLMRRAESILVHSESARTYVRNLAPLSTILVHPQTSDSASDGPTREQLPHRFEEFSAESPLRLVVVGQLLPRKHVAAGLRFLAQRLPPDRHVHITIAGSGPDEQVLRSIASESPSHLRVEFAGYVPPDQLGSLYQRADALFFPTLHDDWGLVVNEALQHGLPVIGSDASGAVQELVSPGVEGLVHPAGDDEEMLKAVLTFYALSSTKRAEMSQRCRLAAARLGSRGLAEAFLSLVAER